MQNLNETAFISLHESNYPRIHAFVRRRIDDDTVAEEITADVFRIAWEKWPEHAAPDLVWLLTVARNLLGNAYRSRERHRSLLAKAKAAAAAGGAGPFPADGESDGAAAIVLETLAVLRAEEREILRLFYWDGLSLAEIGRLLGCRESAAKVRLQRARQAFRRAAPAELQSVFTKAGA